MAIRDSINWWRQEAITELFLNGIGISGKTFDKYLKEYNEYKMALHERCQRIANKQETEFIEFVRIKEGVADIEKRLIKLDTELLEK